MKTIENKTLDEERALYNLTQAQVLNCAFAGAADGESALKQCRNIHVENCTFSLRYPLWHTDNFTVKCCTMDEFARAAVWYSNNGKFYDCKLGGIKIFRECNGIYLENCYISSFESGWRCNDVTLKNCKVHSEYFMLEAKNITLDGVEMTGKYYMQYVENVTAENIKIDTKDAFWHAKNVTVKNSVLKGEYLGWYSEGLTLINCVICGTQPLCYCKNLKLINCRTEGCDWAFEYSEVEAEISGGIVSIRNPLSGKIQVDSVEELDLENQIVPCTAQIIIGGKKI